MCNICIFRFTTVNVHLKQAHLQNTPSSTQQLNSLSLNIIHLVIYFFLVKCHWSLVLVANMSTNSRRGKKVNPSVSEGWCISCSLGTSRHSDCQTWEEGGKRWEGEASPVEAPLPTPAHRKKRCSDCGGEMRWVSRPGLMSRTPNPLHTRDAFPLIRRHMLKMGRPYKWLPRKKENRPGNLDTSFIHSFHFFMYQEGLVGLNQIKTIILLIENHKVQLCYNIFE